MLWFYSFLTVLALNINPDLVEGTIVEQISDIFKWGSIFPLIEFWFLHEFYKKSFKRWKAECILLKDKLSVFIPAFFLALSMVFGYSFKAQNSWDLVFGGTIQFIKSVLVVLGYCILFQNGIWTIFHKMDYKIMTGREPGNVCRPLLNLYMDRVYAHPFVTVVCTLVIAYIPYIIVSYPAIFMGDNIDQYLQSYNLPCDTSEYLNLISEDVLLNGHHPVVHTLLLHFFTELGRNLHSWNRGIFLYALLVFFLMTGVISFFICTLVRKNVSYKVILLVLLYYIVSPVINSYMLLVVKDVPYSAAFALFLIFIYKWIDEGNGRMCLLLSAAGVGMLLFRNEGRYLVLISLFWLLLVYKWEGKAIMISIFCVMGFGMLYSDCILPAFSITPSSRKEMLSIPFQQTARYICEFGEDVTWEERQAISQILDYNEIEEAYNPNLSDPVKDLYNESATNGQLGNYFLAWVQMFFKHPGVYIQATLNNKYEYFYPDAKSIDNYGYEHSSEVMGYINRRCETAGVYFCYPKQLHGLRRGYELIREGVFSLPVLSVFKSSAMYVWTVIIWICYCIRRGNQKGLLYMVPIVIQLLLCMAGPTNGCYFRYLYPVAVCFPIVFVYGKYEMECMETGLEK